jgi:BirA family biotin operon repressor/biotin-[acetyl-CoA-carboxylase] ligase
MHAIDWPIYRFDSLDSSSDEARRRVVAGSCDGPFVIQANRQTKGRGRGTNSWWSDEGSLLVTLALEPAPLGIAPRHESRLALIAALAVIDALPSLGAEIRWPNDVEVGGRKLAGVLPERVETDRGPWLLVGVGINVTTKFDRAPADVRRLATSLIEIDPSATDKGTLLSRFLGHFERHQRRLVADDPSLTERWNALDSLRGSSIRVRQGAQILTGLGRGIGSDGSLRLATDEGVLTIYGGQILRS